MANPIFKIKKNISDESVLSGLTSGELFVNLVTNSLYAQGESSIIRICGQVDTDPTLSSNSSYKIPTQKAVKTYIDNLPQISVNQLEERNTSVIQNLTSSTTNPFVNKITFSNVVLDEILGLTYTNGNFTNISGQSAVYNVSYKVALRLGTSTANAQSRYVYLLKNNGEKYGQTSKQSPDNISGNTGMIIDGNSTFKLNNNEFFSLNAMHDQGISIISGGNAGLANVFENRISIYRLS